MTPEPAPAAPDETLYARVAGGDAGAFADLVARHRQRIMAVAARMTGDRGLAEDIVQETFIRAWVKAPGWRPQAIGGGASFATWLTRIAINLAIDRLRRVVPLRLEDAPEPISAEPDGEVRLMAGERRARLAAAVAALPERQRAAIALTYDQGLSNAAAAAVLESSVGALELLLVRARRALRHKLRDLAEDAP
jgi:RNA polymerase sigma-70 factor (ECF subfamily)